MKRLLLYTFIICLSTIVICQEDEETVHDIMRGANTSFALPLRDLLKKEHENEFLNLFTGFSGNIGFDYPLKQVDVQTSGGLGSEGIRTNNNMTFSAGLKYNPLSYWFANVTYYKYLDGDLQAPWNPDFSYAFGYDDWHPYTFSLVYANYGGNRIKPKRSAGERFTIFEEGGIQIGWKFIIPSFIENIFIIHPSGGLGSSVLYNIVPTYTDLATLTSKHWKQSAGISLKYGIYKWIYANITLLYYPFPEQQQPWDPDFTYGFGYFDWHPGTISIQYNNYSGNRYPWKQNANGGTRLKDGSITITWSWAY